MAKKKEKRKHLKKKLLHKYRLVILNEDTFEERISFKLSRLNVFVVGTLFTVFLIAFTTILIAFTPLREYIPGYSSTSLRRTAVQNTDRVDSLERVLTANIVYLDTLRKALTGEVNIGSINRDSLFDQFRIDPASVNLNPNKQDSLLRVEVANEDKYNLFETATSSGSFVLFPPVTGQISQNYSLEEKHFAVDIIAPRDTPVKAVGDGTVIFSEWTAETGYVIILEHAFGLISVYKHNGSLTKSQGDLVKSGEVIATVGNTGELTTGPHLHFELWSEGYAINPTQYIDFE
ncbi:peptidoglycan DD-metalloendopeptidase family protein [Leptobacterium flavescens]|uniref:Peptidoglycan DD-metalloendopeptidase family protein n=1 Tax=Leptobacterium flavescens TaxID=472055 RepID=A0A6P0UJ69_9FLAO|nr:M23 family metallopeptidase [Leptobacterium flavescens]NER13264.1 peptidoglycan DD-metalloendopeptidase family protein [Leptobacterium flavescens]